MPHLWLGSALLLGSTLVFAGFTMGSGVMVHKIGSIRFTADMMDAGIRRIGVDLASIFSTTGPIATLILAYFLPTYLIS